MPSSTKGKEKLGVSPSPRSLSPLATILEDSLESEKDGEGEGEGEKGLDRDGSDESGEGGPLSAVLKKVDNHRPRAHSITKDKLIQAYRYMKMRVCIPKLARIYTRTHI